jgi:hypothetical protein
MVAEGEGVQHNYPSTESYKGERESSPTLRTQRRVASKVGKYRIGAGDGNRTRVNSLEGYRTAIVLHPPVQLSASSRGLCPRPTTAN